MQGVRHRRAWAACISLPIRAGVTSPKVTGNSSIHESGYMCDDWLGRNMKKLSAVKEMFYTVIVDIVIKWVHFLADLSTVYTLIMSILYSIYFHYNKVDIKHDMHF